MVTEIMQGQTVRIFWGTLIMRNLDKFRNFLLGIGLYMRIFRLIFYISMNACITYPKMLNCLKTKQIKCRRKWKTASNRRIKHWQVKEDMEEHLRKTTLKDVDHVIVPKRIKPQKPSYMHENFPSCNASLNWFFAWQNLFPS